MWDWIPPQEARMMADVFAMEDMRANPRHAAEFKSESWRKSTERFEARMRFGAGTDQGRQAHYEIGDVLIRERTPVAGSKHKYKTWRDRKGEGLTYQGVADLAFLAPDNQSWAKRVDEKAGPFDEKAGGEKAGGLVEAFAKLYKDPRVPLMTIDSCARQDRDKVRAMVVGIDPAMGVDSTVLMQVDYSGVEQRIAGLLNDGEVCKHCLGRGIVGTTSCLHCEGAGK